MRIPRQHSGAFALVMVLLLVAVASIMGMACLGASSVEMAGTENLRRAARSRYLGESGVYHALALLQTDPDAAAALLGHTSSAYHADGTADTYAYTIAGGSGGQYTLTATGQSGGLSQAVGMTVKLTGAYYSCVLGKNPLTYWRLGEASGSTAAESVRGANGTYYSMTLGDTGAAAGDTNRCPRFNGFSSYVKIPHWSTYQVANGTIVLWLRPTSTPGNMGLLSKNNKKDYGYNDQLELAIDSQGRINSTMTRGGTNYSLAGGSVQINQWHCAALTFGAAGMKLYLNGSLVAGNNYTGGLQSNAEPIILGASADNSPGGAGWPLRNFFRGNMDEVTIFSSAKSAQEILQIYNAQAANVTIMSWDR